MGACRNPRSVQSAILVLVFAASACDAGTGVPATPSDGRAADAVASVASAVTTCEASTSRVVINEFRLSPNNPRLAFVELYNPGAAPVDLSNSFMRFEIDAGALSATVVEMMPEGLSVPPGGYLVSCVDMDPASNGGIPGCGFRLGAVTPGTWRAFEVCPLGTGGCVDRVEIPSDRFPANASVALRNPFRGNASVDIPANPDDPAAWSGMDFGLSTTPYGTSGASGTPGARNTDVWSEMDISACDDGDPCTWDRCVAGTCDTSQVKAGCRTGGPCVPAPSPVVLNEVRVVPGTVEKDFVEILNPGAAAVDLSARSLVIQVDTGAYQTLVSVVLPSPLSLPAGGMLLACGDPDPARNDGVAGCAVTLAGLIPGAWEMVALWDPARSEYLDRIDFASDQFPGNASMALRHPARENSLVTQPVSPDDPAAWAALDFGLSTRPYGAAGATGTPGARNDDVWAEIDIPACDDGDACSWDRCLAGACDNTQRKPGCCTTDLQCFDGNLCTMDRCIGNACTWTAFPDCCRVTSECDDANPCTSDLCLSSRCTHLPRSGCCVDVADCNDGSACTLDMCVLGHCLHESDASACCIDDAWCLDYAEDGNPCSAERCLFDPATGRKSCQHVFGATCTIPIPWQEGFDGATPIAQRGWEFLDLGAPAADHWSQTGTGDLGPDGHLVFTWIPSVDGVRSLAATPTIDASSAATYSYNVLHTTTVQWRMRYVHAIPGREATLKLVATPSNQFADAVVIWSATVNDDLPYGFQDARLPEGLYASPSLRLGFLIDTGADSTAVLDRWEIDDVRVGAGVPNRSVKAVAYRCPETGACNVNTGTLIATAESPAALPDVTLDVCQKVRVYLCQRDEDAYYATWQFFGFPGSFVDSTPFDAPPFMAASPEVGQANGCETLPIAVQSVCGVPAATQKGYFMCAMDIAPGCNDAAAERYRTGLRTRDEHDPHAPPNSPFEALTSMNVNVLLRDGYIVWAPNGWKDPAALAVRDAIRASGRKAQVVADLSIVPSLGPYAGIWAVLGVSGRYHEVTGAEAARLKAYLDGGGRMVLEGGDFFSRPAGVQANTVLHPYFKVRTVHGGTAKLSGPVTGRNFLEGDVFDYDDGPQVNAGNDAIEHLPEQGGKEILRVEGPSPFATAVAYAGGAYRTIGASSLFAGLVERAGQGTKASLMARLMTFLENGSVPCTIAAECADFEACTTDACVGGACRNDWRSGCVPCVDDAVRPSGAASCSLDQACRPDLGYCVSVRCNGTNCTFRRDAAAPAVPVALGASNPHVELPVVVTRTGLVGDLQVKVRARVAYRGYLQVALRGPDGTEVMLKAADPTDAGKNVYATYDIGVPLPSGQALDAFLETEFLGTWTLVVDNLDPAVNPGWLDGWHLWVGKSPKCWFLAHCDDFTVCTTDACDAGYCRNTWIDCSDGNGCTDDGCNATTGCWHANHARACEDGDLCTFGDRCGGGACAPGGPRNCDDGNACTDDSCDPATGCRHVANDANPCSDGDGCTQGDHCSAGACLGTPYECDDGVSCTDDTCNGDGTCGHDLWDGWCRIDGACQAAGEIDPTDPCKACDATLSTTIYSPRAEGASCGTDKTCQSGACL